MASPFGWLMTNLNITWLKVNPYPHSQTLVLPPFSSSDITTTTVLSLNLPSVLPHPNPAHTHILPPLLTNTSKIEAFSSCPSLSWLQQSPLLPWHPISPASQFKMSLPLNPSMPLPTDLLLSCSCLLCSIISALTVHLSASLTRMSLLSSNPYTWNALLNWSVRQSFFSFISLFKTNFYCNSYRNLPIGNS